MSGPIVVPLDGSAFAEEALPLAIEAGARLGKSLQLALVHAVLPMLPETALGTPDLDAQVRADERAYLTELTRRIREEGGPSATPVILDGPVVTALIEHARSCDAHLVVMTTHGRGGVSRFFLGSVADRLVRQLHCPVLLVRPGHQLPALRPGERRSVLVPLDGSDLAESMIDRVLELFRPEELTLELVRVVAPVHELVIGSDAPLRSHIRMDELLLAANRYLHAVAVRLRGLGLRVHAQVKPDPWIGQAILRYADEHGSDLIAVATRGLHGFERMMLGSVADKLIRGAPGPVLVWNPPVEAPSQVLLHTATAAAGTTRAPAGAR